MEEKIENKKGYPEGCRCFWCQGQGTCKMWCGGGGHHRLLRWLIGILILIAVFAVGVKLGELKASLGSGCGYGFPRMMHGQRGGGGGFYGPGI